MFVLLAMNAAEIFALTFMCLILVCVDILLLYNPMGHFGFSSYR